MGVKVGEILNNKIGQIFDSFKKQSIFENKAILQTGHQPEDILHRDEQIEQIASILAPALRGERTSNLFVYGQTGTGKTLSIQYLSRELMKKSSELGIPLRIEYLNCKLKKVSDTEYRILAELVKKLGGEVPATGLPTDQVYTKFLELLEKEEKKIVILILDEVDQAVKKISDGFLYNLTRLNSEIKNATVSIIGISNDLKFLDLIDPRVRSSLSEEEIVFPPYNALQLQDILKIRSEKAFKTGVLIEGVIAKCAAYAAREHGDARRALDLLRIAGELAERNRSEKIEIEHIDQANEKIDRDKILDIIKNAPKQFQVAIYSVIKLLEEKKKEPENKIRMFTGDVYTLYQELCRSCRTEVLTQRRVSDLIAEFDMLGLINAKVISKGRHGRTREIKLLIPDLLLPRAKKIIEENLSL